MIQQKHPRIPQEVTALIAALQLDDFKIELLQALNEEQWHNLLRFCDLSQLTLPLVQLPLDNFPVWVSDRLRCNLADNKLRFERIKTSYKEAASALDSAGAEYIVIKGFTQAPEYVATPQQRVQSDLDLYCLPKTIPAAKSALEKIGYSPEKSTNITAADHEHILVRSQSWQWKNNYFDPDMPLGIELHFCLWNSHVSRLTIPEVETFWERRIIREIDGFSFPCLDPVDHLGHLTLHILRNILLRNWIVHHVRELAVFLHSHANDDDFWETWEAQHSPSLRSLEAIAFYHAIAWFQCRVHPKIKHEIESLPAVQLNWLKRFSNSALENMFKPNKDALWLHLSLVKSHQEQWRVLKHTLVPQQIAPLQSPIVKIRNKRVVQSDAGPIRAYISYLLSRSLSHSKAGISTLYRGLSWWLSKNHLPG